MAYTALIVRFIDKLRKKTSQIGSLHSAEITKVEEFWTKNVQRQHEVVESMCKSKYNSLK